MQEQIIPTPEAIRTFLADNPKTRARDAAQKLGIAECQLVAATVGYGATRITAHPDQLIPAVETLGEVMALTRVGDCVHEKVGAYGNYHSGPHASMTLTEDIDLRIFPSHWVTAFAVETPTSSGVRRSVQVFDAAGDAVHKIHLRDSSDHDEWSSLVSDLALGDQTLEQAVEPRKPTEAAKSRPEKADVLRAEWAKLTDTHQFLRLCSKLKMNRLGAYRIAGARFVRQLAPSAANEMLTAVQAGGFEIMLFVGNRGCIQIHTGPIVNLRAMGPWQNVMDPRFNLHLRLDRVAEVWAVEKPTNRGPAVSVEAFDAEGGLIFQVFGVGKEGRDSRPDWKRVVAALPSLEAVPA
ncbi:ChuX/HutX family heme-like substrate-binding protein [Marinovum sp. 2_MG-2023]|uniref:hemin-degrading factor n=1 Tax=unclassified Marinovum TaxID=2647166 RepID=UPI0026E1A5F4|nr:MULTISPECIES: ChuX/HutX family heme-like substrate-binding protein [unclassified Marinovum]MDO6729659.1 ChuX/HutX family heme-like substrate-binding protein [Marinovum sp. 2_MG-2023]MDO6779473.1 ChuX/HutX family heme-like substrate-binding protein [Marinovum sp. 1_MG-2023]